MMMNHLHMVCHLYMLSGRKVPKANALELILVRPVIFLAMNQEAKTP